MRHAAAAIRRSLLVPAAVLAAAVPVAEVQAQASGQDIRLNRTIETLDRGEATFGIFNGDFSLANARSLTSSGLDFVLIDMEHGPWSSETLQAFLLGMTDKASIVRNGHLQMAVPPIVRVPQNGREMLDFIVKQALDMGAFGIMFPFINNRDEAVHAVASMRYPRPRGSDIAEPHGWRGRSPGVATWFWGISGGEYFQRADVWPLNPRGELLAAIQIETPEAVDNIEEIITVPGVGAIFIGPLDLATQMGYGDNTGHPDVEAAIQTVLASCLAHNIPCGLTTGAGNVEQRISQGFRFVTVGGAGGITPGTAEALNRGMSAAGRR